MLQLLIHSINNNKQNIIQLPIKVNLSDCKRIRNHHHNHLVCTQTLHQFVKLAKRLRSNLRTYLYGVFHCVFLSCQISVMNLHSEVAGAVTSILDISLVPGKEFPEAQATSE